MDRKTLIHKSTGECAGMWICLFTFMWRNFPKNKVVKTMNFWFQPQSCLYHSQYFTSVCQKVSHVALQSLPHSCYYKIVLILTKFFFSHDKGFAFHFTLPNPLLPYFTNILTFQLIVFSLPFHVIVFSSLLSIPINFYFYLPSSHIPSLLFSSLTIFYAVVCLINVTI